MYAKLMVVATTLVLVMFAVPGAMAKAGGEGQCAVEDVGCVCTDGDCGGLTGQKHCAYSAGPTPGIQVGILCDFNLTGILDLGY